MLKISADRTSASTHRPDLIVDHTEEAQLNALHDRLLELARAHELHAVQPEAVSFMARAIKVVSNRLVTAAVLGAEEHPTADGHAPASRTVTADHVHDAIRRPTPAPWMIPPGLRAGHTLSAFNKFVP